jgi:hypothetical protein
MQEHTRRIDDWADRRRRSWQTRHDGVNDPTRLGATVTYILLRSHDR